MSRAPTVTSTRDSGGFFSRWRGHRAKAPGKLILAEALTESEAREELARRQTEEVARRDAALERENTRRRQAEDRAARKAAAREAKAKARAEAKARGERSFTLGTAGSLGLLGLLCAIVLAAYSLGRQSAGNARFPTVAAVANRELPAEPAKQESKNPQSKRAAEPAYGDNPELAQLLHKPAPIEQRAVRANQPARAAGETQTAAIGATSPEQLNYLQIESFLITRERNGEQIAADLAHARKFLADRGVRTFARKKGNGYVLYAEEGLPPGKEHAVRRDALRNKIQQLGQAYRAAGGLYQFKGSLFVSFEATRTGDPV
jgi:hypothetical protein